MKKSKTIRIFFDLFVFFSIFFFPWWFVSILAIVGLFLFDFYFEILLVGVLLDAIYFPSGSDVHGGILKSAQYTLASVVFFTLTNWAKEKIIRRPDYYM